MSNQSEQRRVALVTGAGKRIGRAIAKSLAKAGWQMALHYRNSRPDAESLVREIVAEGGAAVVLAADLARHDDVMSLVPQCAKLIGAPACLINNASEFHDDTAIGMTGESWDRHLDVNLKAPVFLAQALARHLSDGVAGNVVNIIDQRVLKPSPEFFSYSVSKAALRTATQLLAQELAPRIRVNAVAPGPVLRSVHQSEAEFAAEQGSTLLRRGATPEEIASAVRFILDAPAMTGQMIALDSGQHLV